MVKLYGAEQFGDDGKSAGGCACRSLEEAERQAERFNRGEILFAYQLDVEEHPYRAVVHDTED